MQGSHNLSFLRNQYHIFFEKNTRVTFYEDHLAMIYAMQNIKAQSRALQVIILNRLLLRRIYVINSIYHISKGYFPSRFYFYNFISYLIYNHITTFITVASTRICEFLFNIFIQNSFIKLFKCLQFCTFAQSDMLVCFYYYLILYVSVIFSGID